MAFSTYHDPKGSSFVSQWSPKEKKEDEEDPLTAMFNIARENPVGVASAGWGGLKRYVEGDQETRDLVHGFAKDVGAGALKGGLSGAASGGIYGALAGAGIGAVRGGYEHGEAMIEEERAEEERLRQEAIAADAARLAQEAAIANQRLGGGSVPVQQDPFATNYSYQQPTGYDDWYSSIFNA